MTLPEHYFDVITRALDHGIATNIPYIAREEPCRTPTMSSFTYKFEDERIAGIFEVGLYRSAMNFAGVSIDLQIMIQELINSLGVTNSYIELNSKLNNYLEMNKLSCRLNGNNEYDNENFHPIIRFSL